MRAYAGREDRTEHMVKITHPDGTVTTTSNDITWARAVYREADGYQVSEAWQSAVTGGCTCHVKRVCDYCYGNAYSNLYNRH